MKKIRNIFIGSFIGAFLTMLISSTCFFRKFKNNVRTCFDDWDDIGRLDGWSNIN
jgi:hypothetical protein